MTSLAFLQTDADPGVTARSPMARSAAAAGARFEPRDGWETAVAYSGLEVEREACRTTVGFADRSELGVIELQGTPAQLDAIAEVPPLQPGLARLAGGAWWCRTTPERAFAVCAPGAAAALRGRLEAGFAGHVLDAGAGYGAISLIGPQARETIARLCALDLRPQATPVCGLRPGSFSKNAALVLREAQDSYLVIFGAAYGAYVWTVVEDAATALGGRPVGADAVAALGAAASPIGNATAKEADDA